MLAAALLVVLGSAVADADRWSLDGDGAFLAGIMLAESSYRHELEADNRTVSRASAGHVLHCRWTYRWIFPPSFPTSCSYLVRPAVHACQGLVIYVLCRPLGLQQRGFSQHCCTSAAGRRVRLRSVYDRCFRRLLTAGASSLLIASVTLFHGADAAWHSLARRYLTGETKREEIEEDFEGQARMC